MRTLSSALITELGLTITRPGYLVELQFSTILRMSTLGDITWNSQTWSAFNIGVSNLSKDGKGSSNGTVTIGNTDGAIGALVLNEGASDIPVNIWAVYAGATATGDPVQEFSGVSNGTQEFSTERVSLNLVAQGNITLESPRVFISQVNGFNWLKPAGSIIYAGTEIFTLPAAARN